MMLPTPILMMTTPSCACRGVWIFRGPDIPRIMLDECYDMELYDWVKADINDPVRAHLAQALVLCIATHGRRQKLRATERQDGVRALSSFLRLA